MGLRSLSWQRDTDFTKPTCEGLTRFVKMLDNLSAMISDSIFDLHQLGKSAIIKSAIMGYPTIILD